MSVRNMVSISTFVIETLFKQNLVRVTRLFTVCSIAVYPVCLLCFSESAKTIDARVQKGLFMFAVSNSCMNPIVYGKLIYIRKIYKKGKIKTEKKKIKIRK